VGEAATSATLGRVHHNWREERTVPKMGKPEDLPREAMLTVCPIWKRKTLQADYLRTD